MKTSHILIAAFIALALPFGASATEGPAGTLELNTTVDTAYQLGRQFCPPGTPVSTEECVIFTAGPKSIRGLGRVVVTYVKAFDNTICPDQVAQQKTTVFTVAGRGELKIAMDYPVCADRAPSSAALNGTIAEGTGTFSGASGSVRLATNVHAASCGSGGCRGGGTDTWTGNINVPGLQFDLTPPVFQRMATKLVKAPKRAKTVRVSYAPKAQDAVDGRVRVICKPKSGSLFKVGRTTRVGCTAEDKSANVATTSFRVRVTRSR